MDSNDVEIDDDITSIVGMTGSGKTSFLKMVSGIDPKTKFRASDLPLQSKTRQDFFENKILSKQIPQLTATFTVEELDRPSLPAEYKEIKEIEMQRNFDGSSILISKGKRLPKMDMDEELRDVVSNLNSMRIVFEDCIKQGMDYLVPHRSRIIGSMDEFTKCNFSNTDEIDLTIDALRNALNTIPTNSHLRNKFNTTISNISVTKNRLQEKIHNHPYQKLYAMIPKPVYKSTTFTLEDEISIDTFMSNPKISSTFLCIAVVAGLHPNALQGIRNTSQAEIQYYLNMKSKYLSDCLNRFWKQETYEFELGINNDKLMFLVKDKTTGTKTSVLDRSDGFKWWVAFFLEVSTILAQTSGRSIILLDNPATELHDEGKGDVLRFISSAANSDQLQIIYSTHERALVDPWRVDRIRIAKLTKEGTKIQKVSNVSDHDLLDSIRKNIGSPARYSLFGAPATVFFEGPSDVNIVSAVNEYVERQRCSDKYLHKDSFSINSINGICKAPDSFKLYKQLGLQFVIVVDSGTPTNNMKKKIDPVSWKEHFVEIKQITGKNGDTEDMVHPELYYAAFKSAYSKILDQVPRLDEIKSQGADKKRTSQYERWFEGRSGFDKVLVSNQMFKVLMERDAGDLEQEWLSSTAKNFELLFEAIRSKINPPPASK